MKTKLILFILATLTQSCAILNEDEFTNERSEYTGNAFRFDGCYINSTNFKNICHYNFFFRNGVLLSFGDSCGIDSVNEFKNVKFTNLRGPWRIFHVDGDKIVIKYWTDYPGLSYLDTDVITYKIINDTTLSQLNTDGKTVYCDFKKFTIKPDSINPFIK
jgi:hypothetical protein